MSVTTIRSVRKPSLSPAGEAVRQALVEATKIVDESTVGKYLLESKDSPEGFAMLIVAAQERILEQSR